MNIPPLSYTNKDFASIYEELLHLAKKISYKWDPTISNESDPGVVLLKLAAIVADKNNYNIDKNVLEFFPETVTQLRNARNLFKQLGYNMKWYNSAECEVTFKLKDNSYEFVSIPAFTMVSNDDDSVVYTLMENINLIPNNMAQKAKCLQGIITTLQVNGKDYIDIQDLDDNNRVYFPTTNVPENGIFITTVDSNSTSDFMNFWERVDNLSTQPLTKNCFYFGIDSFNNLAYIQFPEDIADIIKEGLTVRYLLTSGHDGNIAAKRIIRFYGSPNGTVIRAAVEGEESSSSGATEEALSDEFIDVSNGSASIDGEDPEDIDSAYNNYKKVVGTFDTLVTLKDYISAIYNSNLVSNGLVMDRTNDIQTSYKIVSEQSGFETIEIIQSNPTYEKDGDKYIQDNKSMSAFDLKMVLLQKSSTENITTGIEYNKTFNISLQEDYDNVELYLDDKKHIQHNFKEAYGDYNTNPFCFINEFPIKCTIIPHKKLEKEDIKSLKNNVKNALFEHLNARKMTFGEEPSYFDIYNIITNCDERIKLITLDNFTYRTKAIYLDSDKKPTELYLDGSDEYGNAYDSDIITSIQNLKKELLIKSILSGNTNWYVDENSFRYRFGDAYGNPINNKNPDGTKSEDILQLKVIPTYTLPTSQSNDIPEKLTIQCIAPNYEETISYSGVNYCLQLSEDNIREGGNAANVVNSIPANSQVTLHDGEYLYMFYGQNDGGGRVCVKYGDGTILRSNAILYYTTKTPGDTDKPLTADNDNSMFYQVSNTAINEQLDSDNTIKSGTYIVVGNPNNDAYNTIPKSVPTVDNTIIGNRTYFTNQQLLQPYDSIVMLNKKYTEVVTKYDNADSEDKKKRQILKGNYKFYFITSNVKVNEYNELDSYVMELDSYDDTYTYYVLQNSEYFMLVNTSTEESIILGAGTRLTFKPSEGNNITELTCKYIDPLEVMTEGQKVINRSDYMSTDLEQIIDKITIEEMQTLNLDYTSKFYTEYTENGNVILTDKFESLTSLTYIDANGQISSLPTIESNNSYDRWLARAVFPFTSTNSSFMEFEDYISIEDFNNLNEDNKLNTNTLALEVEIRGKTSKDSYPNILTNGNCFYSKDSIFVVNTGWNTICSLDENGKIKSAEFYPFTQPSDSNNYDSEGNFIISNSNVNSTGDSANNDNEITTTFPAGLYLFKIYNPNAFNLNLFTVTDNNPSSNDLVKYFNIIYDYYLVSISSTDFNNNKTNYYTKGTNGYTQCEESDTFSDKEKYYQEGNCIRAQGYTYAQFKLESSTEIKLSYIGEGYKNVKIFAAQSIRDRVANGSDNGKDKALLETTPKTSFYKLITETTDGNQELFDKDGIFNYTYRNEENDNNPLESKNFFNQNHIYNQNTIGKITTEDVLDNITVLNMGM